MDTTPGVCQNVRSSPQKQPSANSAIFYRTPEQQAAAERSREVYQKLLTERGYGAISTEIVPAGEFYFAEGYHQQYLDKNPWCYCPDNGTGITCPVGVVRAES